MCLSVWEKSVWELKAANFWVGFIELMSEIDHLKWVFSCSVFGIIYSVMMIESERKWWAVVTFSNVGGSLFIVNMYHQHDWTSEEEFGNEAFVMWA